MKKIAKLLKEYSSKVLELKPEISWGNPNELTDRMNQVSERISKDNYDLKKFYFSDFNGKSPQGEIWEYLDSKHPDLKKISNEIREIYSHIRSEEN